MGGHLPRQIGVSKRREKKDAADKTQGKRIQKWGKLKEMVYRLLFYNVVFNNHSVIVNCKKNIIY